MMSRLHLISLFAFFVTCGRMCVAADITIETKRPLAIVGKTVESEEWTVTYYRKGFDETKGELHGVYKTEQAAQEAAKKLRAGALEVNENSDFRIVKIVIEGKKTYKRDSDEVPMELQEVRKLAVSKIQDAVRIGKKIRPDQPLTDYKKAIKEAYQATKELRDRAVKADKAALAQNLKDINDVISSFNSLQSDADKNDIDIASIPTLEANTARASALPMELEGKWTAEIWNGSYLIFYEDGRAVLYDRDGKALDTQTWRNWGKEKSFQLIAIDPTQAKKIPVEGGGGALVWNMKVDGGRILGVSFGKLDEIVQGKPDTLTRLAK